MEVMITGFLSSSTFTALEYCRHATGFSVMCSLRILILVFFLQGSVCGTESQPHIVEWGGRNYLRIFSRYHSKILLNMVNLATRKDDPNFFMWVVECIWTNMARLTTTWVDEFVRAGAALLATLVQATMCNSVIEADSWAKLVHRYPHSQL